MNQIEIWSKQTTVKVLADKTYDETYKNPGEFVFHMAKNEHESAQIIITPQSDVSSFSIELSHLKSEDRMFYIWKDQLTVYLQKYICVSESSPDAEKYGNGPGLYPDALLPFEKVWEYGENKIKAGQNQAIFISLKVPSNQRAGNYKGAFTLTVDGEKYSIPVKVTVWDFEVSSKVHCQSDFVIGNRGLQLGENDYFPAMYRKYVEKLIEFRLAPHRLMQFMNRPYNEGSDFVEAVRYYMAPGKPDLSTIMLPVYPHAVTGIDEPDYKKHVLALADACIEDGVNYFAKAAVYCGFIDEPHLNNGWDETNRVCKRYEDLKNETADEFEAVAPKTEFAKEVITSMREVPNFVTIHFDERITEVKNWCPRLACMATKEEREQYRKAANGGKNWWYQCGVKADTPNYGIDHNLIDARILMWMTYDYGLQGTLYWETVQFFKWVFCLESHINHEVIIDCYKEPVRCAGDNGDGFLLYPGKPYGIFGPVESIRLHAIRDGYEEYEYLYLYENLCKQAGKDFREEMEPLFERLYDGVIVKADADTFDEVRSELAEKIVSLQNEIKGEI
ncbi:MAG: DUF4091 domain-containing protein [Tyzzerella sp.]|nr:DUF4091 domain-containing protein [Tyzzerella sp.]